MSDLNNTSNPSLKKYKLGVFAAVGMIYSLTAAGAYGIEDMIPVSGPGMVLALLLIIPIFWAFPQAFANAEMGSAYPVEGGPYKWIQDTQGEFWSFQFGWWRTVGGYLNTVSYVVLAAAYLASALSLSGTQEYIVKILIILVFTIINLRGIHEVAIVNTVISVCILIAFALVAIVGFMHMNQSPVQPFIPEGQGVVESIGYGLAIGMWMYGGWEAMGLMGGELENPQVIPKALLISVPLIMATYIIPTLAGLGSVGQWESWGSEGVSYYNVLLQYAPGAIAAFFVFIAVISNMSLFNSYLASTSRGFFVMAADNLFPKPLVKVSKNKGVPYVGIISVAVVSFLVCQFSFTTLVMMTVTMSLFTQPLIQLAGILRRKRKTYEDGPYKFKVSDSVATFYFALPCIVALLAFYLNGSECFIYGNIGVISGPIAYFLIKRVMGGLNKIDPIKYPLNNATGMNPGDLKRIGFLLIVLAVLGILGMIYFPIFEGAAGGIMTAINVYTVVCVVLGVIIYALAVKKDQGKVF